MRRGVMLMIESCVVREYDYYFAQARGLGCSDGSLT